MSAPHNINFRFYPSLIDKFDTYLNPGKLLDYGKTEDEIEQELINAINRVPSESEAAEKGTAFNRLVDDVILGKVAKPQTDVWEIQHKSKMGTDFTFQYPTTLVSEFADYFKGAIPQNYCSGLLDTCYGVVHLYGYADEIKASTVYDIKTTGNYEFPKYLHSWQRHVYPYCLTECGIKVDSFEFTITDFKNIYKEFYSYDHIKSSNELTWICERFIEFLQARRDKIYDKKIFNQQ